MGAALVTITVLSFGTALVLTLVVVRLTREERRRAESRMTVLRALAAGPAEEDGVDAMRSRPAAADSLVLRAESEHPYAAPMFVETEHRSPWLARLGVGAAVAAFAIAGILAISLAGRVTGRASEAAQSTAETTRSLELMSLQHAQQPATLTISGLVRNPGGAAAHSHLVATAFLFAADGTFVNSGRAPIDETTLEPGDESGFTVSVAADAPVARYRVSFRDEQGRVVAHVDRRRGVTAARTLQ